MGPRHRGAQLACSRCDPMCHRKVGCDRRAGLLDCALIGDDQIDSVLCADAPAGSSKADAPMVSTSVLGEYGCQLVDVTRCYDAALDLSTQLIVKAHKLPWR